MLIPRCWSSPMLLLSGLSALAVVLAPPFQPVSPAEPPPKAPGAAGRPAAAPAAAPEPYLRIVEDGDVVRLEVASRRFVPPAAGGPEVHLVGVAHIGDRSFYEALQAFLDQHDVVLFEAVKPSAEPRSGEQLDDQAKAASTRLRQTRLSALILRHRATHGALPGSLQEVVGSRPPDEAGDHREALLDAWGRPFVYRLLPAAGQGEAPGYEIVSLGADGEPGGDGAAADLVRRVDAGGASEPAAAGGAGIQQELASALGLVFQMSGIDYNRPNWRNSDLSIDAIRARLAERGADADALLDLLKGESLSARFASLILGFVRASPTMQAGGKIMMIEMLGQADRLEPLIAASLGPMAEVIIGERNAVVIDDLRGIIEGEPGARTVGVFYGAAHLPDLERRLVAELGYTPGETRWFAAIEVDPAAAGLQPAQVSMMRGMISAAIDAQVRRLQARERPAR